MATSSCPRRPASSAIISSNINWESTSELLEFVAALCAVSCCASASLVPKGTVLHPSKTIGASAENSLLLIPFLSKPINIGHFRPDLIAILHKDTDTLMQINVLSIR